MSSQAGFAPQEQWIIMKWITKPMYYEMYGKLEFILPFDFKLHNLIFSVKLMCKFNGIENGIFSITC